MQSVDLSVPFAPVSFQPGRPRSAGLRAAHHQLPAGRRGADGAFASTRRSRPLAEYRDAELQQRLVRPGLRNDHPTPQIARRPACARWSTSGFTLRDAAIRARVDQSRRRAERAAAGRRRAPSTVEGGAARGDHGARRSCSTRRCAADRGSRSTIRCSKAGIAPRSTPSTAAPAFPDASRSTSSRCRQTGALAARSDSAARDGNGFGADVLAVADGTIAAAVDDTPTIRRSRSPPEMRQRQLRRARPRRRPLRLLRTPAAGQHAWSSRATRHARRR